MTCIVQGDINTKKAFKALCLTSPDKVHVYNPAITGTWSGSVADWFKAEFGDLYVTNHPKRSWFARVTMYKGKIKVE